jgi:hypothetical protein
MIIGIEGRRETQAKECRYTLKAGKDKGTDSSGALRNECSFANTSICAQCKINVCCFKPLSFW